MKIAIYQMEVIGGKPAENRLKVQNWLEKIMKEESPDTIVLPEMWTSSFKLKQLKALAETDGEPTKSFLSELAKKYKVNIIGGSIPHNVETNIYNTSFIFNREGEVVYEYSKIHLVPMLHEHLYVTGGKKAVEVFELDGIKMGIIICYDLRFPELARSLALQGVQALFVVAAWPTPRKYHWTALQIARAIENQMYVISCNAVGNVDDVTYAGNSMIIDPWGDILKQGQDNQEETLVQDVNLSKVVQVRKEVPIFKSRVPDLY